MDFTSLEEQIKFSKDLYKSLTPVKRTNFSENMTRRRIPFLQNENTENDYKLIIKKLKNKENSFKTKTPLATIDNEINIKANELKPTIKRDIETDLENENWLKLQEDIRRLKGKNKFYLKSSRKEIATNGNVTSNVDNKTKTLNETRNSSNLTESSDYYSNDSVKDLSTSLYNETTEEISLKHFEENIKPLTNSTFIIQNETNGNETQDFQTASSFSLDIMNNENCNIKKENKTFEIQSGNETQQVKNQIPLIKINETEIVDNSIKTNESKRNHLKFQQFRFKPKHKEYEEVLQKIANKRELYKQIAIKDKVMEHLLEIALVVDFPKLKHICRKECERNEKGLCEKQMKIETEKESEESTGLLKSIWSAIKYPFAGNSNKEEKKKYNVFTVVVKEKKEEEEQEDNSDKIKYQEGEQMNVTKNYRENKMEQKTKGEKQNSKTTEMETDSKENDSKEIDKTKESSPEKETNSKEIDKGAKELEKKKQYNSNKDLKTEKSPKSKEEISKNSPQKVKKKSKPKKRFLFFFQRSDSSNERKESNKIENNKIENMEDVWEELEQAEKKISEEDLKKLDTFLTENKLPGTKRKFKTNRSDSF
ncbi:uncharacterized protein ACRADG_003660 [Cochliomyia hominivorax]